MSSWKHHIRVVLSESDLSSKLLTFCSSLTDYGNYPLLDISLRNWDRTENRKEIQTSEGLSFTPSEIFWLSKLAHVAESGKNTTSVIESEFTKIIVVVNTYLSLCASLFSYPKTTINFC